MTGTKGTKGATRVSRNLKESHNLPEHSYPDINITSRLPHSLSKQHNFTVTSFLIFLFRLSYMHARSPRIAPVHDMTGFCL